MRTREEIVADINNLQNTIRDFRTELDKFDQDKREATSISYLYKAYCRKEFEDVSDYFIYEYIYAVCPQTKIPKSIQISGTISPELTRFNITTDGNFDPFYDNIKSEYVEIEVDIFNETLNAALAHIQKLV